MPANTHASYIIKRPLITEKSTFGMNEQKRYAFEVDPRATKTEIKAAIQELYKVRVLGINTQVRKGKFRRMKYGLTQEKLTKRAIVRLHQDDVLELI